MTSNDWDREDSDGEDACDRRGHADILLYATEGKADIHCVSFVLLATCLICVRVCG